MPNLDGRVFQTANVRLTAADDPSLSSGDTTQAQAPRFMPDFVADTLLDRVEAYTSEHGLGFFRLVLGGAEPALWPEASFERFFGRVEGVRRRGLDLSLCMQTRGVDVTDRLADRCVDHGVRLGIRAAGPSHDGVKRASDHLLARHPSGLIDGFLCVMDPGIEPGAYLEWIRLLPITRVDLLWPVGFNHANPPWAGAALAAYIANPPYGLCLAELFERWWALDDSAVVIHQFSQAVAIIAGSSAPTGSMSHTAFKNFVVGIDGRVEYPDHLCGERDEGSRSGCNLIEHPIQRLHTDPVFGHGLQMSEALPMAQSVLRYDHACFWDAVCRRVSGV